MHRTAGRAGLVCPVTATLNATDPGRDSSTKDRTYLVTATDYAGNQTTQTFVVRRDLQKPTVGRIGGELARVARNKASGRTDIVPTTITGADSQSGIARLEILARRQTGGKTYVIGTIDADCASGCDKRTSMPAAADLSLLPNDGRYRLQVRVTDQAGNQRTFNTGTLFLDWKAPSAPKAKVTISQRDGTASALVKPGRDPAESSGRGDYYLLYPAKTDDDGRAFRSGDRQVREIVDQLRPLLNGPTRVVRSKTNNFPLPGYQLRNDQEPGYVLQTDYVRTSSGERRVRVLVGRLATARFRKDHDVYKALGLDKYDASTRTLITRSDVPRYLKPLLRTTVKLISRASIGLAIGADLYFAESTGCDALPTPGMFEAKARGVVAAARRANWRAATAKPGPNTQIRTAVAQATRRLAALQADIDTQRRLYGGPCDKPANAAHDAKNTISRDLQASADHLTRLAVQKERDDAFKEARKISEREKSGTTQCVEAGDLKNGERYVVYWSPPPPPNLVEYVGISRSLKSRCRAHPADRRGDLETLDLPYLSHPEARNVEEALIAHFGPGGRGDVELSNDGKRVGRLGNKIHSVGHKLDPAGRGYCA